jgi:transcriptional regulator with XRE-family HTH domain
MGRAHISKIERGLELPSLITTEKIAAVFGLDIAGLFLYIRQEQRQPKTTKRVAV